MFFAIKIKIFSNIKTYHSTALILIATFLVAISFLNITVENIDYADFIKWLIIAFVTSILLFILYDFKVNTPEIFKELPIIMYLAVFGARSLMPINEFNLLITVFFTIIYLIILLREYKLRQIKHQLDHA